MCQQHNSHRQARFPLSHWDWASSTLGIPQRTLTQQVVARVLYTVSHLRREQLSSSHHHESPFSNRKQLCTRRAWFAMCRNPSQRLKRQLPKKQMPIGSVEELALKPSHVHGLSNTAPAASPEEDGKREAFPLCKKGMFPKRGQSEGVWRKHEAKEGRKEQ